MCSHVRTEKSDRFDKMMFLISGIMILLGLCSCKSLSLNADEAYTLALVRHPWRQFLELICGDVHPPLYYFTLKLFVQCFIYNNILLIISSKLFSMIPFIAFWFFGLFSVGKDYGKKAGGLFSLLIIGMPSMIHIGSEIRMYSFGMLFVVLAVYQVIRKGQMNVDRWIKLVFFSICACYSHYYACISIAVVFTFLFFICIKKKHSLKSYFLSVLIIFACYIPWMWVMINQVKGVSENFWIPKVSVDDIINIFMLYFKPYFSAYPINAILSIMLIIGCFTFFYKYGRCDRILICILMPIIVAFIVIVISVVVRPILIARYLVFSFSSFWLGMSIVITESKFSNKSQWLKKFLFGLIILISGIDVASYIKNEYCYDNNMAQTQKVICEFCGDNLITNDLHIQQCLAFYSSEKVYGVDIDAGENTRKVYDMLLCDGDEIYNFDNETYIFSQNISDIEAMRSKYIGKYSWSDTKSFDIEQYHIFYVMGH